MDVNVTGTGMKIWTLHIWKWVYSGQCHDIIGLKVQLPCLNSTKSWNPMKKQENERRDIRDTDLASCQASEISVVRGVAWSGELQWGSNRDWKHRLQREQSLGVRVWPSTDKTVTYAKERGTGSNRSALEDTLELSTLKVNNKKKIYKYQP